MLNINAIRVYKLYYLLNLRICTHVQSGKLPMDPNMMRACEEGKSFLEAYPGSVATAPFAEVVRSIVQMTPDR